ncbi:hypothetical protein AGDE_11227 [Angomonas deanei]|uniref:Uncharacterized protein n=1 Tax=Angomonas deanei TaxID=59799 RepID=A0A7G2C4F8_9TRYP|nr:hypothetical protein AGDE_11227 [Angomonas deanei]CAD2214081.1 hypothetical protein, conserved [Angomonas deanei]|eukprot:EPY26534.1 hypothetical protein AGDE_11227 [Angomonas deanei]
MVTLSCLFHRHALRPLFAGFLLPHFFFFSNCSSKNRNIVMGCKSTKTKDSHTGGGAGGKASPQNESSEFLILANKQQHPVAKKLLEEWTTFAVVQEKRHAGDQAAVQAYQQRSKDVWADTENQPVTHRSVDYVGKVFLEYIRADLLERGWGGNFDYKVAGVTTQGFLKANVNVDTAFSDEPEEVEWEIKIHYHSSGAS